MKQLTARLGEEKINKLLVNLSLPATIGMMVNALYNLVDTIFVGRGVGALAIGGLTIAFPIQMVIMAFAQMIGIGTASAISRSLGAKDIEKADYVAGNSFLLIVILSSIITAIGLTFTEPMLRLFGATDTILPYAKDYITIILWGSVFSSFAMSSNNLIRAEGNAKVAMATMLIGAILNIILDPIFIFVFKMGVKGAALATVISKFVSFLYVLTYLYSGKSSLKVKLHHLKPKMRIMIEILTVGFAAFARQVTGSVVAIVVNNSLRIFGGDMALIIVGILHRVTMFVFMPLFGVIQGMQPIVGFNYGAKKLDRVKETLKLSLITTTVIATFGWLIIELFPFAIISVFTRDAEIIEKGSTIMRIVISVIPVIGIQIVGAALFQSLGKAVPSLILALLRQVLLFIPLVIILPRVLGLGLWGIWIAYPAADILSVVLTVLFLKSELKKMSLSL
ncbi:MAG: Multi antimicrobial extrusion protein (Na(+)/drug antiporter) [Atribacteria bacterium 34_128]|nr:MAG: Multi antimicrobial extrusion protein (Na(+)/drug antiporter) [Atribacteria bacterium 34_128]